MIKRILEKPEYVMGYIKYKSDILTSTKLLRDNYILFLIIAIPTSYFGVYSEITAPIFTLDIIFIGIWAMILGFLNIQNKRSLILFHGVYSILLSIVFMIAAYKFLSIIKEITFIEIFLVILFYMFFIAIYNIHI